MTISREISRQPSIRAGPLTILLTASLLYFVGQTNADRISDKIYSVLQSNHFCSRRLNATHQVGCQSELGGNLGVVWIVETNDDLDHIIKSGPTPPYIAVLRKNFYSRDSVLDFKSNPDRVTGVVFLDKNHDDSKSRSSPFSPDDVSPNRYSGLYVNDTKYNNHAWQETSPISSLLYDDIPFPIFLINEKKSIDAIESCFYNNNVIKEEPKTTPSLNETPVRTQAPYPLCGIQLDSFMMAAQDSTFCLNSHFMIDEILQSNARRCYPVENSNIFAYYRPAIGPLHPTNDSSAKKPDIAEAQSVVLLIAKLSSLAMFSELSPGADSTITSIVTLLTVADALGRVKNSSVVTNSKRNIAFALLDSEPFDYLGSSKMVHDMSADSFPYDLYHSRKTQAIQNINLASLDYIINLDQMANYANSESLHFHTEPRDNSPDKLNKLFNIMQKIASSEGVKLEREQDDLPLPPTSVHTFIAKSKSSERPDMKKLTGVVLSNYGKTYKNLLYHSIYDDSHNVYQTSKAKLVEHLAKVSRLIARSLYEITFSVDKSDEITIDKSLLEQLLNCYLVDAACPLFTRACRAGQKMPTGPIPTFKDPSVRSDDINGAITANLLIYFLGDKIKEFNFTNCRDANYGSLEYNFDYINDKDEPIADASSGACIKSQVLLVSANSPAYNINEDNEIIIDPKYPVWTVSLNSIRNPVRLYLIQSPFTQWSLFVLGVAVTISSFIVVKYARDCLESSKSLSDAQMATST